MPTDVREYLLTDPPIWGDIQPGSTAGVTSGGFVPAPKVAQAAIRFIQDGQPMEVVLNFAHTGSTWTVAELQTLCEKIDTHFQANVISLMNLTCAYTGVYATDRSAKVAANYTLLLDPYVYGTQIGVPEPAALCIGLSAHIGLKGQGNVGKIFTTGSVSAYFTSGVPDDTARAGINTGWANFMKALGTDGYTFCLVQLQLNKVKYTIARVTSIYFLDAMQWIAVQRRRLPGHNRHR